MTARIGSKSNPPMTTAQLLVIQGRPAGKVLQFPQGDYYIGRGAECHIRPDSDWVSRQHCLLRVADDGVFLRDLGSRNGTLVNGRLVSGECRLEKGDQIQIGPLVFEVGLEALETSKGEAVLETMPSAPPATIKPTPAPKTEPPDKPTPLA